MGQVPSSQLELVSINDTPAVLNTNLICSKIDVLNNTGKTISVIQYDNGVAGPAYIMPAGSFYHIEGIENANQITASNATDSVTVSLPFRFYS